MEVPYRSAGTVLVPPIKDDYVKILRLFRPTPLLHAPRPSLEMHIDITAEHRTHTNIFIEHAKFPGNIARVRRRLEITESLHSDALMQLTAQSHHPINALALPCGRQKCSPTN
jgi:hypothetical protein